MERCREKQDKNCSKDDYYPNLSSFRNLISSLAPLISLAGALPAKGSVHETHCKQTDSRILLALAQF